MTPLKRMAQLSAAFLGSNLARAALGFGLTLAIGPRHLDTFSRLAVFSSGAGQNPEKTLADIGAPATTN